jgi:hypothetical protein
MPEMNFFSNGRNKNELNQVFAAGYSLGLLNANLNDADHIRSLIALRQRYKDVLINGRKVYQPTTVKDSVLAFNFQGVSTEMITLVNASDQNYSGRVLLRTEKRPTTWRDLLDGTIFAEETGCSLPMKIPPETLRVFDPRMTRSQETRR